MGYSIGIDLGTTYSCLAVYDETREEPKIVKNFEDEETTPSIVGVIDGVIEVGNVIKQQMDFINEEDVVVAVKRHMDEENWSTTLDGKEYSTSDISNFILRKLIKDFKEKYDDCEVKEATITVPAYFSLFSRTATINAGKLAGLDKVNILEEPVAAALSYGLAKEGDRNILIYDLGGGTFDVTVVIKKGNNYKVIAKVGNQQLGGKDWDEQLKQLIYNHLQDDYGKDIDELKDDDFVRRHIENSVEDNKRTLSTLPSFTGSVPLGPEMLTYTISRQEFEDTTYGLLSSTMLTIDEAVEILNKKLGMSMDDITDLVLVGGSTKMPQVRKAIENNYPSDKYPNLKIRSYEPNLAVASGAAIYQHLIDNGQIIDVTDDENKTSTDDDGLVLPNPDDGNGGKEIVDFETVLCMTYGIEAYDERLKKPVLSNILFKNEELPHSDTREFTPKRDGQTSLKIRIYENETEKPDVTDPEYNEKLDVELEEGREVGSFIVEIPSDSRRDEVVTITIMADKSMNIKAICKFRDIEKPYSLKINNAMSDEEIEKRRFEIGDD